MEGSRFAILVEEKMRKVEEGVGSWTSNHTTRKKSIKAQKILDSIDLVDLAAACERNRSKMHDENPSCKSEFVQAACSILEHWSMGSRAFVVEARFTNGTRWAVKISMEPLFYPKNAPAPGPDDVEAAYDSFETEFDTMQFIRDHITIPVPKPHFIMRLKTSLGPSVCFVMDLIPGCSGEFSFRPGNKMSNPDHQRNVRRRQD